MNKYANILVAILLFGMVLFSVRNVETSDFLSMGYNEIEYTYSTKTVSYPTFETFVTVTPTPEPAPLTEAVVVDRRAGAVRAYLRANYPDSPLTSYADLIVEQSDKYGIDYSMVIGIAVAESTAGTNGYYANTCHNAWGYGVQYSSNCWESWNNSIPSFIQKYAKGYGNAGAYEVMPIYCPSCTTWADKIVNIQWQIKNVY